MKGEDAHGLCCAHDGDQPVRTGLLCSNLDGALSWALPKLEESTCVSLAPSPTARLVSILRRSVEVGGAVPSHHRDLGIFYRNDVGTTPGLDSHSGSFSQRPLRWENRLQIMSVGETMDGNTELRDGRQGPSDLSGHCVIQQLSSGDLPTRLSENSADELHDVCRCLPGAWWQLCSWSPGQMAVLLLEHVLGRGRMVSDSSGCLFWWA